MVDAEVAVGGVALHVDAPLGARGDQVLVDLAGMRDAAEPDRRDTGVVTVDDDLGVRGHLAVVDAHVAAGLVEDDQAAAVGADHVHVERGEADVVAAAKLDGR